MKKKLNRELKKLSQTSFRDLKIFGHCLRHKTRKKYENILTFTSYYPLPEAMRKAFLSNHTSKMFSVFERRRKNIFVDAKFTCNCLSLHFETNAK